MSGIDNFQQAGNDRLEHFVSDEPFDRNPFGAPLTPEQEKLFKQLADQGL